MSETVININSTQNKMSLTRKAGRPENGKKKKSGRLNSGILEKFYFVLVFFSLGYGWIIREEEILTAESGWGYWLGIIGGSLMLVLMLYPARKHMKFMRNLGPIHFWFRFHMAFGVLGPITVLYHANFGLGSVNSNVALFAMLTVSSSGLVGRFFYTKIHNGLYGQKTSLEELQRAIKDSIDCVADDSSLIITETVQALEVVKERFSIISRQSIFGIAMLPFISIIFIFISVAIQRQNNRHIELQVADNKISVSQAVVVKKHSKVIIKKYLKSIKKVFDYVVYERIFSLWHILHLPLFFIMLTTGLFHVYAVHMY